MPRPVRTLLIVVVVGLAGIVALTWMARRYASLKPEASVADVAPATTKPAEIPPPATEPSPVPPAPEAATAAASESDLRDVDRFVAVRSALQTVIDEQPESARQLAAQLHQGDPSKIKPLQLNFVFLMKFRLTREQAIQKQEWSFKGYRGVRDAFEAWRDDKGPADPALKAALDRRREALRGAFLGELEALDRAADSGMSD